MGTQVGDRVELEFNFPSAQVAEPEHHEAGPVDQLSFGQRLILGDRRAELRAADPPIIARVHEGRTVLDLRTVDPTDDAHVAAALGGLGSSDGPR